MQMYSTDTHTSNNSYSSNPSTPVASPPPLISDRTQPTAPNASGGAGNPAEWVANQTVGNPSPPFIDSMQQLVSAARFLLFFPNQWMASIISYYPIGS